jgi:hypothetical protein
MLFLFLAHSLAWLIVFIVEPSVLECCLAHWCVIFNCCSQKLLAGDPLKHLRLEQAGCQHQAPASVKLAHLLSLRLLLVYTHPFIFFFCYAGDCVLYDEGWAISRCLYEDIVNPHMRYFLSEKQFSDISFIRKKVSQLVASVTTYFLMTSLLCGQLHQVPICQELLVVLPWPQVLLPICQVLLVDNQWHLALVHLTLLHLQ